MADWRTAPIVGEEKASAPPPTVGSPAAADDWRGVTPEELDYSGAPYKVRLVVGLAKSPQDQLATLKKFYPDARPIDIGPKQPSRKQAAGLPPAEAPPGQQLIVFTNPETQRLTVFNPPGMDVGDVMEFARPAARIAAFGGGYAAGAGFLPGGQVTGTLTGVAASQGADELIDRLLNPALGVVDTRTGSEKTLERVGDVATELPAAVAIGAGSNAMRVIGGAVTPGSGGLGPRAARLRIPDAAGSGDREVYQALKEGGVERPPAAMVSKSADVRGLYEAGLKHPDTADILQPEIDKALGQLRATAAKELGLGNPKSPQVRKDVAGSKLSKDLTGWRAGERVGIDRAEMTMDHLMAQRPVNPDATAQYLRDSTEELAAFEKTAKAILPKEYWTLKADLEAGKPVPWRAVRRVRTLIGRKLEDASPAEEEVYKPLYGVLSTDLAKAASEAKGQMPGLWKDTMAVEARVAEDWKAVRALTQQPEVETAFNLAANGAAQGPSRLEAIRAKVSRETWDALVNTMAADKAVTGTTQGVEAGGLQTSAVFNPPGFAKWWRDMKRSGSADVLAPEGSPKRKAFDRWETIGASFERSRVMRNLSNTSTGTKYLETLEGGGGAEAGAAAAQGAKEGKGIAEMADKAGGWLLNKGVDAFRRVNARDKAQLLADPDFAKWMVDSRAIKPRDTPGAGAHVQRLSGIALQKPELRGAIGDFMEDLKGGDDTEQK